MGANASKPAAPDQPNQRLVLFQQLAGQSRERENRRAQLFQFVAEARRTDRSRSPAERPSSSAGLSVTTSGFKSMSEAFAIIPEQITQSMANEVGQDRVDAALQKLATAHVTTSFSGSGLAEVAVAALGAQHATRVHFGRAIEWLPVCQKVLSARDPGRCIFEDISSLTGKIQCSKKGSVHCRNVARKAHCVTHKGMCEVQPAKLTEQWRMEIGGPPCPPWSSFGSGLGTDDHRYTYMQAWACLILKELPDIVLFENVSRFERRLLEVLLGKSYNIFLDDLDPRFFGYPMARPRCYGILVLKQHKWIGPSQSWLECMAAVKRVPAKNDPLIFAERPDLASRRQLTDSEKKHLKQYESLEPDHRLYGKDIVDLQQSTGRPVGTLKDNCLPTILTTNKLYVRSRSQFLSGAQLLRAMGWPVHASDSQTLGLAHKPLPPDVQDVDLKAMAGNGMFSPCLALACMAALLFVELTTKHEAQSSKQ